MSMIKLLDRITPAKLSVVCGVKNRLPHLEQALPTWLACPQIDEVVIVDWDSTPPLQGPLFADPRIRLVRVNHQPHWVLTKCFNLGLLMATGDVILKLDGDNLLEPDFFANHPLDTRSFYSLDGSLFAPDKLGESHEAIHLWGVLYADALHFKSIGGYDERIVTYGWDDSDVIARLTKLGLERRFLDIEKIHHIHHSNGSRLEHSPMTMMSLTPTEAFRQSDVERACLVKSIFANKDAAEADPWSAAHRRATWRITKKFVMSDTTNLWTTEFEEAKP